MRRLLKLATISSLLCFVLASASQAQIAVKYKIAGMTERTIQAASLDQTALLSAVRADLAVAGISESLLAAGLSYFDSTGVVGTPSTRTWLKVANATVRSNEKLVITAGTPLLIPDSAASTKEQYYRLYSIPVNLGSPASLDSAFEGLGSFTAPTTSRITGYFISSFKKDAWTTSATDVSLTPGQGGIIRAAATSAPVNTTSDGIFIKLTGSSTPPEGDRGDSVIGKIAKTGAEPSHTGVDVELKPGWNIVGVPMYKRFFWSITGGIYVLDLANRDVVIGAVGSSLANGFVSPVIYGRYDPSRSNPYVVIDASDINVIATDPSRIMQPFEGYWVFAFLPCKLRFLASADGPDSSAAAPLFNPDLIERERITAKVGWGISLSAKTINSVDAGNIIGYGFKQVDYMKPPSLFEDDVRLSILSENGLELTRSVVNRLDEGESVRWNIVVESTGDSPVTLSGGVIDLPKDYQMMLIDSDGREMANLKVSPYTYIPKSSGLDIFKVLIAKKGFFTPKTSALLQNYPNPFNPETWIPYQLSKAGEVNISIYNLQGQLVRSLSIGRKEAGVYINKEEAAYWDGRNSLGERVSSGIYFYSIQAGQFVATRKLAVVK